MAILAAVFKTHRFFIIFAAVVILACSPRYGRQEEEVRLPAAQSETKEKYDTTDFYYQLSKAALLLTRDKVTYDPSYFTIAYPNGDVPADKGVCSDVVIRAYRKSGIDLQQELHKDIAANFSVYPQKWGLKNPDKNIDHRRVPNLMRFFERNKASLPVSSQATDYRYGDIVCWQLQSGQTHIGMIVHQKSPGDENRYQVVHNIGAGQVLADCLFNYKIIGHYRYKR